MDEVPPPEAFEPQAQEPVRGGRLRRRLRVVVTLLVVLALVVLAAAQTGGFVLPTNVVEDPAVVPMVVAVEAGGALTVRDGQGGGVVPYPVADVTFQFPSWSPDGTRIATLGQGAGGTGLYVFTVGGDPVDPVVVYKSPDRPPFYLYWSPDGQSITFLTTEADGLALRIVPADGSVPATIVRAGAPMYWDYIDPARLLVHSGTSGADEFFGEVGLDGAVVEGTARAVGVFRAPAMSGDDRFRGYLGAGDGSIGEVVRESRDGSGTTRIRVFGSAAVSFSPTDDALAFVAPDQFTSDAIPLPVGPLRILDAGAAEPRTLLAGNVVAFFWAPTGTVIAALRLGNANDNVTEAAVGGAAGVDVVAREVAAGLPLRLSFVDPTNGAIRSERTVQVSDLFVNQVLPFYDQYALSHRFWSPDGKELLLPVVGDADVTQLFAIPVDGSDARTIATAEIGFWSP